jgi:glutamate synthase (ferredoxin)
VYNENGKFKENCNKEMVYLEDLQDEEDAQELKDMITKHANYTESTVAKRILENWDEMVKKFVKVIPKDYKVVLQALKRVQSAGLSGEEAMMAAFQENNRDMARVSGN